MSYVSTLLSLRAWLDVIIILTLVVGCAGSLLYFVVNPSIAFEWQDGATVVMVYSPIPIVVLIAGFVGSGIIRHRCESFIQKINEILPMDQ